MRAILLTYFKYVFVVFPVGLHGYSGGWRRSQEVGVAGRGLVRYGKAVGDSFSRYLNDWCEDVV